MSYFLILRTGLPGSHQFSPRYVFASIDEAHETAERARGLRPRSGMTISRK